MKWTENTWEILRLFLYGIAVYTWLTVLSPLSTTDTRYSVYLLIAVVSLLCACDYCRVDAVMEKKQRMVLRFFSVMFALAVLLANYTLFEPLRVLENVFDGVCVFVGGCFVSYPILSFMVRRLPLAVQGKERKQCKTVFFAAFLSITAIDMVYLFCVLYPGVLTTDSYTTMRQLLGLVPYDNTMPIWHTFTVKVFVEAGLAVFGDMNAAVTVFHCAQILFLAAVFGFAIVTLYQIGVPESVLIGIYGMFAWMPYNIVYSVTLWKDIPFGAAALLFITAFYRILNQVGKSKLWNYIAFVLGILGFSLWRTNGWYAFAVVTLVMTFLLRKSHKGLLLLMAALLLLGWIMIGPLLDILNVEETNFVEAFAVPMQQVARVIYNERDLTQQETELLSVIFRMDKVRELYDPKTVDPVKFETFRYGKVDYILEHPWEYLSVYIQLGLRYPGDYLKAWIDETKGYWNGGYSFWTFTLKMGKNELGIFQTQGDNLIASLYRAWFRYVAKLEILQFTDSIGLYSWALTACCLVNVLKKRKEFLLTVPCLVLIVGLCLGTPVFAEFRYAYPMILSTPFILAVTFFKKETQNLSV